MEKDCPIKNTCQQPFDEKETSFLIEQYRVLAYDRISHNQLFWNVQLMFLTAQSFLLILALGGFGTGFLGRAIGGLVGALFGLQTIQGFERNRMMEIADADILLDIERFFIKNGYQGLAIHNKPNKRKYLNGDYIDQVLCSRRTINYFSRGISYELWKCGLWLITMISFVLFLYSIFVFCFSGTSGMFFFSDSFTDFTMSIDRSAIGAVIVLFAVNWGLYVISLIQKEQPKRQDQKKKQDEQATENNNAKQVRKKHPLTEDKREKRNRVLVYCFEGLLVLIALFTPFSRIAASVITYLLCGFIYFYSAC